MLRRWIRILPIPGTLALVNLGAAERPAVTTIRAVTISPEHYANRAVTVAGRFRGRSGAGDEPLMMQPLNRSRWDFLLKADDAAVWVSGLRPAGWDFDLNPLSPVDSRNGRWLEVTGTVRVGRPRSGTCAILPRCAQLWIEATDLRDTAMAFRDGTQVPLRPPLFPPKVVFHDPIADETGVPRSTAVRLQFSRHMVAETLSGRVRASYASPRSLSAPPIPKFTAVYREETRALELRFVSPLDSFQTIRIELLEGIAALNGRLLEPWAFSFTTGGDETRR